MVSKACERSTNFHEIVEKAKEIGPKRTAIVFPYDPEIIKAAMDSSRDGLILPVFVGDKGHIAVAAREAGVDIDTLEVIHNPDPQWAADMSLDMMVRGEVNLVVKGKLLTTYLYRSLIRIARELAPEKIPFTICFHTIPGINKIFAITDPGVNISPDLLTKQKMAAYSVQAFQWFGYTRPRIMFLASTGHGKEQSQAIDHARKLIEAGEQGKLGSCEVLPYTDLIEMAEHGQFDTENFPDIFVVPHIDTGNILVKTIDHIMGGVRQCITLGGGMVVLTPSRSDGYEVRRINLAIGMVLSEGARREQV